MSSRRSIGPLLWVNLLAAVAGARCASSARVTPVEEPPGAARAAPPRSPHPEGEAPQPKEETDKSHREGLEAGETAAKIATLSPSDDARYPGGGPDETPRIALPRLTSVGLFTQIYARASRGSYPLGYVHVGASVALRSSEPLRSDGCKTAWYAVEPRGYVCNDNTTILETETRQLPPTALRLLKGYVSAMPHGGPLPYGYALSLGTPMYGRIPEAMEQRRSESVYGTPPATLGTWAKGHDGLASTEPVTAENALPWFVEQGAYTPVTVRGRDAQLVRKVAPRGSTISFVSAFESQGRTWLVTPELSLVPANRVRVYRETSFHGVELGEDLRLPIAWIRRHPRPKWRGDEDGRFGPSDESWPVRTAVGLTGRRIVRDDRVLLETREAGAYLDAADATLVAKAADRPPRAGPHDKWIQVSIEDGTLTAYRGSEPVFATLISPGSGGLPRYRYPSVHELATRHTTPLGVHRIQFKDRFTVMSPDPEQKRFFISDVPFIQYFYGPFALHAAYWHEEFGEPMSGGCVNLAPSDAEWLFGWTEPALPAGWHAVRPGGPNGAGTIIQVVP